MMRHVLVVFLVLLVSACTPEMEGRVEIDFAGFGFETYFPITPDNIEQYSDHGIVEATDPRFQEVMGLINGAGSGSFYAGTTRVRLRDGSGATVYVDNYGGIGKTGRDGALDEASLNRIAELLWSMTAPRQSATGPDWAIEAARAYLAETRGWAQTEYRIEERAPDHDDQEGLVILRVLHPNDIAPTFADYNAVMTGNRKSFELHLDPETKEVVREVRSQ